MDGQAWGEREARSEGSGGRAIQHTPKVVGQVQAGQHRCPLRGVGVVDHGDPSIPLFDGPDVGWFQAHQGTEDGFVHGIVGHHQGGFVGGKGTGNRQPGAQGAVPDVLDGFSLGHLDGLGSPFPVGQQLRPTFGDLLLQSAFPKTVPDFPQTIGAGEGHTRVVGENRLGGLPRPGHRTGVGPVDLHFGEEPTGGMGLGDARLVEGDIDLSLESTLAVPIRFAMAHQHDAGAGATDGQGNANVGGTVQGFDLNLRTAPGDGPSGQIEHGNGGIAQSEPGKAAGWKGEQLQQETTEDSVVGHHQHRTLPTAASRSLEEIGMGAQQSIDKSPRLSHQLLDRAIARAIGTLQLQGLGGFPPEALPLRIHFDQLRAQQTTPRGQINLEQPIIKLGAHASATSFQQQGGGVEGSTEGGAVDRVQGEIGQGLPGKAGLVSTRLGEGGAIVPPLDALFEIEAALAVADQNDAEGHRPCATGRSIVWEGQGCFGRVMIPKPMTFEANRLSGPRSTTKSQDPPGPPPGRDGLAAHPGLPPPAWKSLLALISLALSLLLWWNGLVESLDRPSVMDSLSLRQLELTALATDALPESLRSGLAGDEPRKALVKELERQFEAAEAPAPVVRRLELELLQRSISPASADQDQLRELMAMVDVPRRSLLKALIAGRPLEPAQRKELLVPWEAPTLVEQLSCEQLGGPPRTCPAAQAAPRLVLQLIAVNVVPLPLVLVGIVLLARELWIHGRKAAPAAAPLEGPRLSLVDLILLIAGGFVMLGEVVVPVLLQPPLQALVRGWGLNGPLGQGIQVLVLYLGLMVAPLSILWLMLRQGGSAPTGGWLQWHWIPVLKAIRQALGTLLMVLPVVALAGWGIEQIWGDPGGSNPLLDLVLTSSEPWSLLLFGITAIVLAPLFEETLFRGVLLPVLGRRLGGGKAVVITAAVFALAHLSLGELIPLFLLGIGLGWLRWRSGRLSCSVWMHGLWNGLTFLNLLVLAD